MLHVVPPANYPAAFSICARQDRSWAISDSVTATGREVESATCSDRTRSVRCGDRPDKEPVIDHEIERLSGVST